MAEETNEPSLSQALATPETGAVHSQVVIEKWLENQTKEIETRQLEVDLQKQTDNHNFEYAKTALRAQATDSESERIHASQRHRRNLIFTGFMAAALIFGADLSLSRSHREYGRCFFREVLLKAEDFRPKAA